MDTLGTLRNTFGGLTFFSKASLIFRHFLRSRVYIHTLANIVSNMCWFLVTKTFHDIQVKQIYNAFISESVHTNITKYTEIYSVSQKKDYLFSNGGNSH